MHPINEKKNRESLVGVSTHGTETSMMNVLFSVLDNSSHTFRVEMVMAMAQWLTLLECHHIQLNNEMKLKLCL